MEFADILRLLTKASVTGDAPYTHTWTFEPVCDRRSYAPEKQNGPCGWCGKVFDEHPNPAPTFTFSRDEDGLAVERWDWVPD